MDFLTDDQIDHLISITTTLVKAKIDTGVVGPWGEDDSWIVGAMSVGSTYALIAEAPEFPAKFAITRVDVFAARLNLLSNKPNFKIGYTLSPDGSDIKSFTLMSGRTKIDFMLGDEKKTSVPKSVNTEILTSFTLEPAMISELIGAIKAFNKDGSVTVASEGNTIRLSTRDDGGDAYETDGIESTDECDLSHTYQAQALGDLIKLSIKDSGGAQISLGTQGVLCAKTGTYQFYMMAGTS